ncbi:MAG: LacI family DNA-binding transcriptional regulator [Albidovulum sp.]|nr:LacI family DNA-binding transcriptional regulator [Albidovulum sp.]
MKSRRPARIADIAREAGVGTATVDRVLNDRDGVSAAMERRVRLAMENVIARKPKHVRDRPPPRRLHFEVLLPKDNEAGTSFFARSSQEIGQANQVAVTCSFVEKMNPAALADQLGCIRARGASGIAFIALDHPAVSDAVARILADGIPVVCISSGLDGSLNVPVVGMDNRAAGRAAGFLMGQIIRRPGRVAVLWGGELYRSHELREIGFRGVLRAEFPELGVLDLVSGGDDSDGNYRQVDQMLRDCSDIVGIYSVGAGNQGVVDAVKEHGRSQDLIVFGHNLTTTTRRYLMDGSMRAVIHQDLKRTAQLTILGLLAQDAGEPLKESRVPVELIMRENMQGHELS